jgi:hypothetical protein
VGPDGGADVESDDDVALWDVLVADPTAELCTVSLQDPAAIGAGGGGGGPIDPNAPPPGQTLHDGLRRLDVAETVLTDAGVTVEQLSAAAAEIADSGAVADAAAHAGVTGNDELAVEVSRPVVATCCARPHRRLTPTSKRCTTP